MIAFSGGAFHTDNKNTKTRIKSLVWLNNPSQTVMLPLPGYIQGQGMEMSLPQLLTAEVPAMLAGTPSLTAQWKRHRAPEHCKLLTACHVVKVKQTEENALSSLCHIQLRSFSSFCQNLQWEWCQNLLWENWGSRLSLLLYQHWSGWDTVI